MCNNSLNVISQSLKIKVLKNKLKNNKYMTQQEYNSRYKILEKHFEFWKYLYNEYVNKREIHTNKFLRIKINSGNMAIEFYKHKLKKDENGMYYNCKMND